jgi:8-oxo-dGTP pyrophosphatase MutT (NUDIX family)
MESCLWSCKNKDETIVPTSCKKPSEEENVKGKKLRVKLICVFPKRKYLAAKTTVEDFHSLFGGVVNQVNQKNHFMSILQTLEREFWEETSHTISIHFNERKINYQRPKFYYDPAGPSETEELPFIYVGTFFEYDTLFTVIYIPKFSNDLIELWNRQIRLSQEQLLTKLFEGWNISLDKLFEVNRVYHQKLMKIKAHYSYMPKTIFSFICSKLTNYYEILEKTGVEIMDEDQFFQKSLVWEWNTMDAKFIHQKIEDLFIKTGVQI